jgi:transcription antitermination factor NusG
MQHGRRRFWSAAGTEYQSERIARLSVEALGIPVYSPLYRMRAVAGVRRVRPLFDRYILVRLDPRKDWNDIHRARGVTSLMRGAHGGDDFARPAVIPDEKIEWLRSLEDELGYIRLEDEEPPAFAFREQVMALKGPFRDQTGEYRGIDKDNQRRAVVAFQVFGRDVLSSVTRYDLVRAA